MVNGGLRKTADSAHTILSEFEAVKAGYGLARFVLAWQFRFGTVWHGKVGLGMVGHGSWGVAGSGSDRHVMVRQLRLVKACFGMVSCGMAVTVC